MSDNIPRYTPVVGACGPDTHRIDYEKRPSGEFVKYVDAQSWVDHAVGKQQAAYRQLFDQFTLLKDERDRYRQSLERICERGRSAIAEEALMLNEDSQHE